MKKRGFMAALGALGATLAGQGINHDTDLKEQMTREFSDRNPLAGIWIHRGAQHSPSWSTQIKRKRLLAHNERQRRKSK